MRFVQTLKVMQALRVASVMLGFLGGACAMPPSIEESSEDDRVAHAGEPRIGKHAAAFSMWQSSGGPSEGGACDDYDLGAVAGYGVGREGCQADLEADAQILCEQQASQSDCELTGTSITNWGWNNPDEKGRLECAANVVCLFAGNTRPR